MTEFALPEWLNVSRETYDRLVAYARLIEKWNGAINLVSKSSLPMIWQRHILDSAQIYPLGASSGLWLDIGSGGGLPGIVVAILGAPDVVLVESDQRKATFLREAARNLGLSLRVEVTRLEHVSPQAAKTISARALAPLTDLLKHANDHLDGDGVAVFLKGRSAQIEIDQARQEWRFECILHDSRTDPESAVLAIRNIERR